MVGYDSEAVAQQIRAEFDRYEAALVGNDVAALIGFFRPDAQAIRMMTGNTSPTCQSAASTTVWSPWQTIAGPCWTGSPATTSSP